MALEQEYLLKQEEAENTYQKKLTAGSGININPTTNVISATGGGGSSVTYTSEYPQGETIGILEINDVQNPIQMPELIPGDNVTITQDVTTGALTIDSTGGGNVDDVKIGNTSIVDANKIANIPTMTGATSQAAGSAGVVPAPLAADVDKFLKADGTWDNCSSATELTKAQYDALPSSKESDGVLYMINDIDTTSGTTSDLTRAAYDLLPASKESDDIFYYITDEGVIMHNGVQYAGGGSGGSDVIPNPSGTPTDTLTKLGIDNTIYEIQGGSGSNLILDAQIYSTDEKQIGIWMDGKPLYQKTINCGALPNNTDKRIQHGIQNVDYFVGVFGIAENPNINSIPIIFSNSGGGGIVTIILEKASDIIIRCNSDRSTYTKTFITLQYTKTTDAAGSGGYQAYGFSPIIYSETEREVGVWVNNKPLYQKSINIGVLTKDSSFHYVPHNIANIDEIVDINGVYQRDDGSTYKLNLMRPTTTNAIMLGADATNIQYMNTQQDDARYKAAWVTLYYTKTTDVAGSGEYNTLGVPTVHYTTDEQVIGTWMDGKTLYQRTWELSSVLSVASNTWVDTSILKQGIDAIIYINGANAEGAVFSFLGARAQTSTTNYVQIQQTRNSAITLKYITVQYTKTTD